MTIDRDTSLQRVAFEVCTALDRVGTVAVLTGGSAAAVHAPRVIHSNDLDFVLTINAKGPGPTRALAALGYRLTGQHYTHGENPLHLEFPPGPLAIGSVLVERWDTLTEGDLKLHVLSPTDSCRDRLAAFYHYNDRSTLLAAVQICSANPKAIHLDLVRRWSREEGFLERYEEFERRVREAR